MFFCGKGYFLIWIVFAFGNTSDILLQHYTRCQFSITIREMWDLVHPSRTFRSRLLWQSLGFGLNAWGRSRSRHRDYGLEYINTTTCSQH